MRFWGLSVGLWESPHVCAADEWFGRKPTPVATDLLHTCGITFQGIRPWKKKKKKCGPESDDDGEFLAFWSMGFDKWSIENRWWEEIGGLLRYLESEKESRRGMNGVDEFVGWYLFIMSGSDCVSF